MASEDRRCVAIGNLSESFSGCSSSARGAPEASTVSGKGLFVSASSAGTYVLYTEVSISVSLSEYVESKSRTTSSERW